MPGEIEFEAAAIKIYHKLVEALNQNAKMSFSPN
jgi:hypothetical protein